MSIDRYVHSYGDLLFDLCESVLWSSTNAQIAFRSILKDIKRGRRFQKFGAHERSWVLKVACDRLRHLSVRHGRSVSHAERIKLDANENVANRLKHFESYFHRLPIEEKVLLLLKDKYGIPYTEIASAIGIPEGSLKVRRQQALRTLEEWLWDNT